MRTQGMQQKFEIVGYLSKASKFNNKAKCQQEKKAINASQSTNNTSRTSYPSQNLIKPKASDKLNLTNLNPQIIELLLSRKNSQEHKLQQPRNLASSKSSGSLETFNNKQLKKQLSNKILQRSIIKQKNEQSIENFNPNFFNKIKIIQQNNQSQKALKSMITCDESLQKFSQQNRQTEQFYDNHQSYQDIQQFNQLINQNIQLLQKQNQKLQQQQIQQKQVQINKKQTLILQQKFQQQRLTASSQSQPQLQLILKANDQQYDIYQQMIQKNNQYKISYLEDFDRIQININKQMRMILIDWIQQVCMEHKFKRETFYLSIYYIDKYLSLTKNIERSQLQLLGVGALQISTKLEEVIPPSMNTIYNFTCGSYTISQINNMEINLIQTLEFKLNPVTLNAWNLYYIQIWDKFQTQKNLKIMKISNDNLFQLIYNLIDFTLLDINLYKFQPQFLSLAAIYIVIGLSLIKRHSFTLN